MKDTYRHKGLRRKLVEELKSKGIQDERVLEVMGVLPRHFFLDKAFEEWAYKDSAFPIGNEQTISQPYTVAYQTILLDVQKREKVLEIGTGSGYQAAILAMLGARVYTVERQELLHKRAKALLNTLKLGNIRCYFRDGSNGLPEHAPFDKIIVTAAAANAPEALLEQLSIGGVMVIPIGTATMQQMCKITRIAESNYQTDKFHNFRFVPFLEGTNPET